MIQDDQEIKVKPTKALTSAWLKLKGLVLILRLKAPGAETTFYAPVEVVDFFEADMRKRTRLIAAFLSLSLGAAISSAAIGLRFALKDSSPGTTINAIALASASAGILVFLFLLIRYFKQEKSIIFFIQHLVENKPVSLQFAFWLDKKHAPILNAFKTEILRRQAIVEETTAYPMRSALFDPVFITRYRMRIAKWMLLLAFPAVATQNPWLLFLTLIPLWKPTYYFLRRLNAPRDFRRAARLFWRKKWKQALEHAEKATAENPDFIPAWMLLIELKQRLGDFDGAQDTLAVIRDKMETDELQHIQTTIIFRRRIHDRMNITVPPADATTGRPAENHRETPP